MKKTKIVCSIGPASCFVETMVQMVKAGMSCARINFSHATDEEKENVVKTVNEVRKITGENIGILYDTKGPEFRNGMLENGEIELVEGATIRVVKEEVLGNIERFSVNHPKAIDSLNVKDVILLENGLMKLEVISKEIDGVTCRIVTGGVLGNKKSLSAPGVKLDIPFISKQDREDIIYACRNEGDFLALSFVSSKEDVLEAREILKECHREDLKIISKIESQTGIDNLDEIIEVSDGIMVARGDLGVEVSLHSLPVVQKDIIKRVREQGKVVIVATEMLESMKKSIRPTRAEVSDVANAVLDGTDAVMLSGETTTGKYPVEVVYNMAKICEETEKYIDYNNQVAPVEKNDITSAIANSVVDSANILKAKLIVATTISGETARKISALRPESPIFATCPSFKTATSLALNFGVTARIVPILDSTDEVIEESMKAAREFVEMKHGDKIVVAGGFPKNKSTNFMKVEEVE